jgi:ribulose-5-phosphate 4-epimerase/fuculose-1-phosphate aldolase
MKDSRKLDAARPVSRRRFLTAGAALAGSIAAGIARAQGRTAGPADPDLVEDLVVANRVLADHGVVDGMGHVSVRHDRDPERFLISRSRAPILVTRDDILEYDLNGDAVDLRGREQYSERYIHAAVYRARPDVNAVVHNHSPAVIPFGISDVPLKPVYHMASFMLEGLPVYDIRDESGITNMLVSSPERAEGLAAVLDDSAAVLMRGHGIVVVGPTIQHAVGRSIYIQINAQLQQNAIALGGRVEYLDPGEAQAMQDAGENRAYSRSWELWKRDALAAMREEAR